MSRILVIDDDKNMRDLLSFWLSEIGHKVATASNGVIGVKSYRKAPADVVLVDIYMPEKEGIETMRELNAEFPRVKIIAMSGNKERLELDVLSFSKQFGAIEILRKPFFRNEVLTLINKLREPKMV